MTWLFVLSAAIAIVAGTSLFYDWWLGRISLAWPVAEAKLDSSKIAKTGRGYRLQLRYSYFVAGSLYGGTWFKTFRTEKEADRLRESLHGLLVLVRYDPRRPERSYFDPYRDIRMD